MMPRGGVAERKTMSAASSRVDAATLGRRSKMVGPRGFTVSEGQQEAMGSKEVPLPVYVWDFGEISSFLKGSSLVLG